MYMYVCIYISAYYSCMFMLVCIYSVRVSTNPYISVSLSVVEYLHGSDMSSYQNIVINL